MNYLDIEVGIDASEVVEQEPVEAEAALRSHYRQVCRNYIAIEATWELIFNLISSKYKMKLFLLQWICKKMNYLQLKKKSREIIAADNF